jgi:uncharacterized protein
MLKFEPQHSAVRRVEGYAGRGFLVDGRVWAGGVIVAAHGVWALAGSLDAADLAPLNGAEPSVELLLIGTGATMTRPDEALRAAVAAQGWALEFMDSRAAARTYNVLVNEGRQVAAALLPV